jgi:hypothetical protein
MKKSRWDPEGILVQRHNEGVYMDGVTCRWRQGLVPADERRDQLAELTGSYYMH